MSDQPTKPEATASGHDAVQTTLSRHGRKAVTRAGGVGLPRAQTLVLRSYETRRITLDVLVDGEWADQLRSRLNDADDRVSEAALHAVDRQAAALGELWLEALLHAIQVGTFNASVVIDTTGYEKP